MLGPTRREQLMGPVVIRGLPAHILLVHLVLAAVPIAALLLVAYAVWPAARRRIGILMPIAALGALITVPITTHAGEWLQRRLPNTPEIRHHVALGLQMKYWMVGFFVVALLVWAWDVTSRRELPASNIIHGTAGRVVVAILAVGISVGAVQHVIRTGEAGSQAVWTGKYSAQQLR
jgi:hypothetical protein